MPRRPSVVKEAEERATHRIERALRYYEDKRLPLYRRWWMLYYEGMKAVQRDIWSVIGPPGMVAWAMPLLGERNVWGATVNYVTTFILTKNAALTTREPSFSIVIMDREKDTPEMKALLLEVITQLWRISDAQKAFQRADLYRRLFGFALLRAVFHPVYSPDGEVVDVIPHVYAIPATRVLYDLGAQVADVQACRWLCEIQFMDERELSGMESVGWKNVDDVTEDERLKPFLEPLMAAPLHDENYISDEDKRIPVFHYWDKQAGVYLVLARGKGGSFVTLYERHYETIDKHFYPYILLAGTELPETFHPLSDVAIMEPHVDLLAKLLTIFTHHALRSLPRFAYMENALTEQGQRALSETSIMAGVEVRQGASLADIQPLPTTPPNPALVAMIERCERDLTEAAGITHYHRAIMPPGRRSATETAQFIQLSGVRGQMEQQLMEDAMSEMAERLYALFLQQETPLTIPIRQRGVIVGVVTVTPQMLPQALKIEVNAGSTAWTDRIQDRNDMLGLIQTLGSLPTVPNTLRPLLAHLLSTFPQLNPSDIMEILRAVDEQFMQQQMQQQMMEQAMQQQAVVKAQQESEEEGEEEGGEEDLLSALLEGGAGEEEGEETEEEGGEEA